MENNNNNNNSLTIADNTALITNIDIETIRNQLKAITNFQTIISKTFVKDHHYGIIPGTGKNAKPTLLQPGAQTICTVLGLQPQYTIENKEEDFKNGFFSYTIRCRLIGQDGAIHADAIASANTKETKFERVYQYTESGEKKGIGNMMNTVLKMAQKRALVSASLFIGCLSDVFTQDLDDLDLTDLNGNKASSNSYEYKQDKKITDAQAKRLFGLGQGNSALVIEIIKSHGYGSSRDILVKDYDIIAEEITRRVSNTTLQ